VENTRAVRRDHPRRLFLHQLQVRARIARPRANKAGRQFRLGQMDEVARELVVKPATGVNPKVKVVLKFPNWLRHYQGLGYNLEVGARVFSTESTPATEPASRSTTLSTYSSTKAI